MRLIKIGFIILSLIALDQFIKTSAINRQSSFNPEVYLNSGISFSILPALPWRSILPFFLFLLIGLVFHHRSYGLSLIIAGGISNLIDRVFRGGVVDFIDLKLIPVFNLADLIISVGSIVLLIEIIKQEIQD